ncbi:MAG: diguanylate cyclase [Thermodesulfobacteriota bacterium]|nr:diguanylate cyclase [Thermodesulfobacteriota bacterium]
MEKKAGTKETKRYLKNLIDSVVDPMLTADTEGIITSVNEEAQDFLEYSSEEIIGRHISTCFKHSMEESNKIMMFLEEKGNFNNYEMLFVTKSRKEIPSLFSASFIRDAEDDAIGMLGIFRDISERKELENELKETKEFLESIIKSSVVAIVTVNKRGFVHFVNNAAEAIMGSATNVVGTHISYFYEGGLDEAKKVYNELKGKGSLEDYETTLIRIEGEPIQIYSSMSMLKNEKGEEVGTLGVMRDITESKRLQNELERLSITDDLTGLYNQRHFYRELHKEIERSKRQNRPLSLLLLDVDGFKQYNDTYGHLEGDKILQKVGKVVTRNIRLNVDSGHRYGGDEFIIILPETDRAQAFSVARRICKSFNDNVFDGVTVSIGLVEYSEGYDLETFIKHADKAMYNAKNEGGNRVTVFT